MGGSSSCAKVWSGVLGASVNGSRDSGAKDLGKVVDIRTFLTAEVAFRVGDKSNLGATGVESASEVGVAIAGEYECGGSKVQPDEQQRSGYLIVVVKSECDQ